MITDQQRLKDFPSLVEKTYLNTAAESIPPTAVHEALEAYWSHKSLGMAGRDYHFAELEACRKTAASMLGRTPEEVAFCSCSSEAYNLLASALQLAPDDEVVVSDLDFPAGVTPWLRSPGCPVIKLWKSQDGVLPLDSLSGLLSAKTKLVQVSLVSFLSGYRIPWAPFRDLVRELAPNAILSVDITQCFGRIELDCLDADCIISSTHKWILGIHGGCVVSIPERAADALTTRAGGWFHIQNAFDPDRFERAEPAKGAAGFAVGMPNFAAIYALGAGMEYLQKIGVPEIARQADQIVASLHENLEILGIRTMAPPQPDNPAGIVAFQHPREKEINEGLLKENIHIMSQAGRLRVAVHGYNRMIDVERLADVLKSWV